MGKIETVQDINLIGVGTTVKGDIKSTGSVRVDGKLIGDITAKENLFIGESGEVEGNVTARNVTIGGKIKGTITAAEKLIFESKSRVCGEIKAAKLVIDEGSVFDGKCTMMDTKQKTQEQKNQEQKTQEQKTQEHKTQEQQTQDQKT